MELKLPNFQKAKTGASEFTNFEVRMIYLGLESPELHSITNPNLVHAINRTRRKMKVLYEELGPEAMVPEWSEYEKELNSLNETFSKNKTIPHPRTGERVWDINFNSPEYQERVNSLKSKYGVDIYEEYMKSPFEENFKDFIHKPDNPQYSREKDVPNLGVYKLIYFLFDEHD